MAESENLVTIDSEIRTESEWIEFDLFNPNPTKNYPYLPKELTPSLELLRLGNPIYSNATDYYYPVLYNGMRLLIETPVLHVPFELQSYTNQNSLVKKYSLHCCLQTHNPESKEFKELIQKIDLFAMSSVPLPPDTYFSCIRYNYANPQLPPVMRIKIPAQGDMLLIEVFNQGITLTHPHVSQLQQMVANPCSVKCILELNNVWIAGGLFGISYKLKQLTVFQSQVSGPLFR